MQTLKLNSHTHIPILGFGTWQLQGRDCRQAVETALEIGYRHLDTADAYTNHHDVAAAIKSSGIPRQDLFITTKIWHSDLHRQAVKDSLQRFLEELQTDYIDLLLIHWPNHHIPLEETLTAMNDLKNQHLVKAIGVSNFTIRHLSAAIATGVEIATNQVELHPTFNQHELKTFCNRHHIALTAYSPIGRGQDLKLSDIQPLAQKHHKSPSQIILNWITQQHIIAIPKATHRQHIEENFHSQDFHLSPKDIESINNIPQQPRLLHPTHAEFDN